jgi:DNA-binding response OmpR family regulator
LRLPLGVAESAQNPRKRSANQAPAVFTFRLQTDAPVAIHSGVVADRVARVLRVLVVEDEPSIQRGLCDVLTFRGYRSEAVDNGRHALDRLASERFDLVLLDVMLPELDGFSVCRELRARGLQLPVLMLTAKGAEDDVLRGFEVGVDDYVCKPFSVRELLARVEALLKRAGKLHTGRFTFGTFEVDPERARACSHGVEVELSSREVHILELLAKEPGRIVGRRTLLREVWGMTNAENVETRTVDVHIAKLRKKLGRDGEALLETVRGQGYRLCTSVR